jgi:hypothetical protein
MLEYKVSMQLKKENPYQSVRKLNTESGLKSGVQENKWRIPGERLHDPTANTILRSSRDENEKTKKLLPISVRDYFPRMFQRTFNFLLKSSLLTLVVIKIKSILVTVEINIKKYGRYLFEVTNANRENEFCITLALHRSAIKM